MALGLDKIAKQVASGLEPDEQVVAACRVMPQGAAGEFIFRSTRYRHGALGYKVSRGMEEHLLGDLPDQEREAAERVSFPLVPQMLLVLTDRRFLVWSVAKFTNKPTDVLGAVPLEELVGVERDEGKLVASSVPRLTLSFEGGDALGLLAARPHTRLLDELAAAIAERIR
jgi:hypothetical protein